MPRNRAADQGKPNPCAISSSANGQEEARRDQAKKLMLAEFDKLKIKSDTLNEQIELLAQPITRLSDERAGLASPARGLNLRPQSGRLKSKFYVRQKIDENRPAPDESTPRRFAERLHTGRAR